MRATRLKRRAHSPARPLSARYTAPALDKGLDILELFASEPEGLTTSQVARRLGRTVGEIFRMLVCLAERGYISQVLPDERFQLTLKLFELAHRHHPLQRFVAKARPLMEEVAHKTRQSCHLAMPSNG
jgi:DNA-binding IclR family transcriptional regulator